jgi:hypothetical protein
VIGLIEHARAERLAVVAGEHDIRTRTPDRSGDVATQRQSVFEDAVLMSQELDVVDADDLGGRALLVLSQRPGLFGCHAVNAGLAAGGEAIADVLTLLGPARDRGGSAVLQVVGMRDDGQRRRPVLVDGLQRRRGRHVS